jgi:hypothetical protein
MNNHVKILLKLHTPCPVYWKAKRSNGLKFLLFMCKLILCRRRPSTNDVQPTSNQHELSHVVPQTPKVRRGQGSTVSPDRSRPLPTTDNWLCLVILCCLAKLPSCGISN